MRHFALSFAVTLAACSPSGGDDGSPGGDGGNGMDVESITVSPSMASLVVVDTTPATQDFTAVARYVDGTERDVTADAVWSVNEPLLGQFQGATFTAGGARGGEGQIQAVFGGKAGGATITVNVKRRRVVDPAPPNAPDLFTAATEDPARKPSVVYPADETVIPPNLGEFEVHWRDSAGNDLYEVALMGAYVDLRIYMLGTPGGGTWVAYSPTEWGVVAESERGGAVTVTVRGLQTGAPQTAGTSDSLSVSLEEQDVEGGLYYWAAASTDGSPAGIYRHDFGKAGQAAEQFYTQAESVDNRCVACHVLSRDGKQMAITFDGGNGAASILDVATRMPLMATDGTFRWNFAAYSPQAERILTAYTGVLTVRDSTSGAVLDTPMTPGYSTHPDWSPLGDKVVYVHTTNPGQDWHFQAGRLIIQDVDPMTFAFGIPLELVPFGGENNYYPAFSPDGEWIAFNRSSEDAYDDASARLYVMKTDGSGGPILLSRPDLGVGLTNSWPRWAPFVQTTVNDQGDPETLYWLTFSSKREFGVRMAAGRPQLWMAPFYPSRAEAGGEPSAPAFRLPFQKLSTNNHIAQWTEEVVPID